MAKNNDSIPVVYFGTYLTSLQLKFQIGNVYWGMFRARENNIVKGIYWTNEAKKFYYSNRS